MSVVQYGLFGNCTNSCDFCLLRQKSVLSMKAILDYFEMYKKNILSVDWAGQFSDGISILGGEIYYSYSKRYHKAFIVFVNFIIENVLLKSGSTKLSSVTNGLYNPALLFEVYDLIAARVGMRRVNLSFSYDLFFRYKFKGQQELVLNNIKSFRERYDYAPNVQMILTGKLIQHIRDGHDVVGDFNKELPDTVLSFLYPHKSHTGKKLDNFFFTREDFIWFITEYLSKYPKCLDSFYNSTINSERLKYTGMYFRNERNDVTQKPKLAGGKELRNPKCGHSIIYKCYSDSSHCMLCDLEAIHGK